MSSLVVESDPSYQEEDDSSSKDSQSDLRKQSGSSSEGEGEDEGPVSNDVVGGGDDDEGEGEGQEEVDSTASVEVTVAAVGSPATVSSMTITLAEAPVSLRSNNGRVAEAPVPLRSNNGRVTEAPVPIRSNDCRVGEATVSTSVVRVPPEKRSLYKFGQRTSNFRGVTRHRWTGKYEAHLWDNSTITEGRKRKGKQVYLGGYETEEKAAQIYDLAALKYWGPTANTKLNFPASNYERELEEMKGMSREEYVNSLRRNSICFTRGCSIYRGVTRQNVGRRWQARIGRVAGGKDIYLGTYDTEEEAAEAYDIAAVKLRGMNAITNFDISNYYKEGTKELDVIPIKNMEEEPSGVKIRYFKLK